LSGIFYSKLSFLRCDTRYWISGCIDTDKIRQIENNEYIHEKKKRKRYIGCEIRVLLVLYTAGHLKSILNVCYYSGGNRDVST